MQFELQVPLSGGQALRLSVSKGDILFVLGANGTGKSSLMHHFYTMYIAQSRRITAHRQTFFLPNMFTLSLDQKRQAEKNILASDQGLNARWTDQYGYQRLNLAISNLVDHEIMRSIKIARAADGGDTDLMRQLCSSQAPLSVVNELLCLSNLPIEVSIGENQQPMASRNGSAPYPVAELSDGERNAVLMASTVLTAKPGEILIIDEPERHLHRSIISPLLTHLFAKRDDCAFVVSTHEVMLPLNNPRSRTLLLRSCVVDRGSVQYWDADFAATDADVSEDLKKDILGARRRVLFVEGTDRSLDQALYSIVFPDITIIAKGSCRDVQHAVSSIRDAAQLHWVHPFGIVDGDGRDDQEVQRLKERGVYALRVFSIESVYYHAALLKAAAQRHADATGEDAPSLMLWR